MKDSGARSLAKTLTWRITGSTSTFIIAYVITGRWDVSSGIAIAQMIVNTFLYLVHERTWNYISWGRR
jgi:uncharacterized membrane protein